MKNHKARAAFLISSALSILASPPLAHADAAYTGMVNKARESSQSAGIKGSSIIAAASPKTPASKTITSFSQSLRCMDELFLQYGKQGIVITSAGIPDETGKARVGTKEMLISALSKMTLKSHAFDFIDFHRADDDLGLLFGARGNAFSMVPDYYIRGSITQMDDNAVRTNKGGGLALPFLDLGASKDEAFDVLSMDMSIGEAATRRIIPETSTSNTMLLSKVGKSGEAGGKLFKMGLSFNLDLSKSEGVGAAVRTLIELGLIESLGKFTRVPYWRCLDVDSTNPAMMAQAQEWFETVKEKDLLLFIQRKLGGMNRYKGPLDGAMNDELKSAIAEYQAATGLIADGRVNFDLYYSLLDDIQNQLAALPPAPQRPAPVATVAAAPAKTQTPFSIQVKTDKGDRPIYHVGDILNMDVSISSQGAVYCYYEDTSRHTFRIFPNRYYANPRLAANSTIHFPSGSFKIKFDSKGTERVACLGSDLEIVIPPSMLGAPDLTPLPANSLDDVISQFKTANPGLTTEGVVLTVK